MSLISSTIPSLIDGISQQSPQNRLKTQGEKQVNFTPSVVEGLYKRNPTKYKAKLFDGTFGEAYVHSYFRDSTEQYIIAILDGDLKVYDLDGNEKTVAFPDGKAYLNSSNPSTEFAATTVGDFTFIVNKEAEVGMDDDDRSDPQHQSAIIFGDFSQGVLSSKMEVWRDSDTKVLHGDLGSNGDDNTPSHLAEKVEQNYTAPTITETVDSESDLPESYGGATGDIYKVLNKATKYRWKEIFPESPAASWESEDNLGYSTEEAALPDPEEVFNNYTPGASGVYKWEVGYGRFFDIESQTVAYPFTFWEWDGSKWVEAEEDHFEHRNSIMWYRFPDEYTLVHDVRDGDPLLALPDHQVAIIQQSVESIQDLPTTAPRSFRVKITGSEGRASYYVEHEQTWDDSEWFAQGSWVETVGPDVRLSYDESTMPHVLVREADGTFTFRQGGWTKRRVGDETSNPAPSFVGQKIKDVFLFKNRLGFLAGTRVTLSQAGSFFNFWRTTVVELIDEDRIDVGSNAKEVTPFNFAIPFEEGALLFSAESQFLLKGGDILSPKTAALDDVPSTSASTVAKPVRAGDSVFYVSDSGSYSTAREFKIDPETLEETSVEISEQAPKYIPTDVLQLAANATTNIFACLSTQDTSSLFMYRFRYQRDSTKIQSAWFKYTFEGADIVGITHIDKKLYLVVQYSDALYLESLDTADGIEDPDGANYLCHLDRRVDENDCSVSYDSDNDETTFTLPYDLVSGATYRVVTRGSNATTEAEVPTVNSTGTNTVIVAGDYSSEPVYIGQLFTAEYRFTRPIPKQRHRDGSMAPISGGRLQVATWTIWYDDTGYFKARVLYDHRPSEEYEFTGQVAGSLNTTVDGIPLERGNKKFPVFAENYQSDTEIESTSHLPCKITSASWEGFFHSRSRRVSLT